MSNLNRTKVRRESNGTMPSALPLGEVAFNSDTSELFVGTGTGKIKVNNKDLLELNNLVDDLTNTKATKHEVEIERKRIDSFTSLPQGSTTGDAELIDGRIGVDGVVYDNIGSCIRTQFDNSSSNIQQMRDFTVKGSVDIIITEHVGYLNGSGNIVNDPNLHCKVTNKIYCNEGWVFYYSGHASAHAISYIMYKGNKVISTGQHSEGVNITIPSNVDNIVFSSYSGINNNIKLDVKLIEPNILVKDNLINNLNSKVGVAQFTDEFRNTLSFDKETISKNNMIKREGVYASINGSVPSAEGHNCYEIDVQGGEVYYYNGSIIWSLAPYHICDKDNNVIFIGGDLKKHDTVTFFEEPNLIIPIGATKLRVCSSNRNGDTQFVLCKKTPKPSLKENEIKSLIENHTYNEIGDFVDITTQYAISTGYYIDGNGKLVSDDNSQYSDYIDILDFNTLYIDAHSKYSTCTLAIYDNSRNTLAIKGSAKIEGETMWNKYPLVIKDILQEYPNAKYIRICSYLYKTYPLKIYERKSSLKEILSQLENSLTKSNVLYGKKYVACGDSFTEGDFSGYVDENGLSGKNSPKLYDTNRKMYKTYPWWIAERNNMTLINEAKCGSTMALSKDYIDGTNTDINHRNPFSLNRYKQVPLDADYLTLWFGLNETKTPLGTLNDTTNETILGAWNIVLEYFLTNMPYCKIGIVISDGWLNDTFANGIISVAKYWGIPYLDLRNNPQVPLMLGGRGGEINLNPTARTLRDNAFKVTPSNGHPNVEAHEYQSTFIENWLRSL